MDLDLKDIDQYGAEHTLRKHIISRDPAHQPSPSMDMSWMSTGSETAWRAKQVKQAVKGNVVTISRGFFLALLGDPMWARLQASRVGEYYLGYKIEVVDG